MRCAYCVGCCGGSTTATAIPMPGSFELHEDMGKDRLQAVEDWLLVEGYEYRFRRLRAAP